MLLASSALASAPMMAETQHAFHGTLASGVLRLSAAAVAVMAAQQTGAAIARQRKVVHGASVSIPGRNSRRVLANRVISI